MTIPGGAGGVNAMAYHPGEDYVYAIAQTMNTQGYVIRIGSDGVVERVVPNDVTISQTTSSLTSGTIDAQGYFWVAYSEGKNYLKIDLNFGSSMYGRVIDSGSTTLATSTALTPNMEGQYYVISDWVVLGGRANQIYTVAGQTINTNGVLSYKTHLLVWNTGDKTWQRLASYSPLSGGTGPTGVANTNNGVGIAQWGAMYSTGDGFLWATENNSGKIYKFNVATPSSTGYQEVSQGPQGGSNDGARCSLASGPV